jgi:hypothetical protein
MCAQWLAPFDPQAAEADPAAKTHAVHAALIRVGPLGSIIYFSGNRWDGGNHNSGNVDHTALYDCQSRTSTRPGSPTGPGGLAPSGFFDIFCSGHALLPDGRLLVGGGTSLMGVDPNSADVHSGHWGGLREAFVFDPATTPKWNALPPMNPFSNGGTPRGGGRWYPSLVTLGDGSIMAMCGHPRIAGTDVDEHPELLGLAEDDPRHNNNTPEIFRLGAGAWELLSPLGEGFDHDFAVFYPRAHVLPTGFLLIVQPLYEAGGSADDPMDQLANKSLVYDAAAQHVAAAFTGPQAVDGAYLNPGYAAQPTTSVLLPLLPENGYHARVLLAGGVTALIAEIVAGSEGATTWVATSPRGITRSRSHGVGTLLPTGEVFMSGGIDDPGTPPPNGYDQDFGVRIPEIFDPIGYPWSAGPNTWRALAATPATVTRGYHSNALLLPDGRVWTAGSEVNSVFGAASAELRVELFEPDYIAAADRATITASPPSVGYGEAFDVHYSIPAGSAHATIARVAVTRCGGATHAFNYDQRYVGLTFTAGPPGVLHVTAPPNGNIAVPGQYLLWILDDGGRPCVTAPFLRIAGIRMEAVMDRSTFSVADVSAGASGGHTTFPHAFYVVFDGFIPSEAGAAAPVAAFSVGGISATPSGDVAQPSLELPGSPQLAQRVTYTYDLTFTGTGAFAGIADDATVPVGVTITSQYHTCTARLDLIATPNPFMSDGPVSYLSTDLRAFQMTAAQAATYVPGHVWTNPNAFIQALILHLNAAPATSSTWFGNLPGDEWASRISLLPTADGTPGGTPVYNFALARVRKDSAVTDTVENAKYVRVMWRVFRTMQPALVYDTSTIYRRATHPVVEMGATVTTDAIPLLGVTGTEAVSIPFFAVPRVATNQDMSAQPDDPNLRTLGSVAHTQTLAFFGCWLDLNQPQARFPRYPGNQTNFGSTPAADLRSIPELMTGFHQCLVAEVHYKHDPASPELPQAGDTPGSSDKLSQRNLAFGSSANPGTAATRTVEHSFELRGFGRTTQKAAAVVQRTGIQALVVWWENVPRNSVATFYFPTESAAAIVAAQPADRGQTLEALDEHTLRCTVIGDCLYLPIPPNAAESIPGLLTLELPAGVRRGEVYHVRAQQFAFGRVLGAFELRVVVKGNVEIVREDADHLALLRHAMGVTPPQDRWLPILQREAARLAARLDAMGVDSNKIAGSPYGAPHDTTGAAGGEEPGKGREGCMLAVVRWLKQCLRRIIRLFKK